VPPSEVIGIPARRRGKTRALLLLAVWLVALPAAAGVSQVRLKLPLKPRLPLRGNEKIAIAPFIVVTDAENARDRRLQNVDLQAEFGRFLKKQINKKTKLEVIETAPDLKLPTQNLSELGRATEFWRSVGAATGAEIVVSGTIEFKVEDRSGYKTEEYVSPINNQTYYRQVYVEQTGFLFDIVFLVFDGRTGEKILQDEFKDFRQTGGRRADELAGLFENLFSLENQILNLFVAREREAANAEALAVSEVMRERAAAETEKVRAATEQQQLNTRLIETAIDGLDYFSKQVFLRDRLFPPRAEPVPLSRVTTIRAF
jgi:hypothetical protein